MRLFQTLLFTLAISLPAHAEPPKVVTDIAPIHSLVASVMNGIADPILLLAPGSSPHHNALRPSQAQDLAKADMIFWMGHELTPWLEASLEALPNGAETIALSEASGLELLPMRDTLKDDGHDHDHGDNDSDPHLWLDPDNAQIWLKLIADKLTQFDPQNGPSYSQNAQELRARLETITTAAENNLEGHKGSYLAGHDSYQYFEYRFGLTLAGAISLGDAAKPGPARIQAIRQEAQASAASCLAIDVATSPDLVTTIVEGTDLNATIIDPLGATLEPGPDLYPDLIQNIASAFQTCLASGS